MASTRISPTQIRRLGWTRHQSGRSKCSVSYTHRAGWVLQHCGHPTANWPWELYDPEGRMHLTGAVDGDPTKGLCWRTIADAMAYVQRVEAGMLPMPGRATT